jgi:hypothetical protein
MQIATILGAIAAIGILVLIGAAFLLLGDRWAKRAPSGHGDFFPTLHLLALAAAVIGSLLTVLSFASDHPKKWLHLTIPVVFVAIVYGYALGWNKEAWIFLLRDIRARVRRKNAA